MEKLWWDYELNPVLIKLLQRRQEHVTTSRIKNPKAHVYFTIIIYIILFSQLKYTEVMIISLVSVVQNMENINY